MLERGMSRRQTGQNITHAHSSRSHAFLTIFFEKRTLQGAKVVGTESTTISLIDLAGAAAREAHLAIQGPSLRP